MRVLGSGGRPVKRSLVLLAVAAVLVSACGSGDKSSSSADGASTTAAVAGAQENAVASAAVCYSWPNGTTDAQPCAVGLKGPGGGRVFYDAGSVQPWGRFLEVAPQNWGGTLVDCSSCGAATEAPYNVSKQTSDGGSGMAGYKVCAISATATWLIDAVQGQTGDSFGDGRGNTSLIGSMPECVSGEVNAFVLAAGYRGLGLSDWYLPSKGELQALCTYAGRNAIGGFPNDKYYISSSPKIYLGNPAEFLMVDFANGGCFTVTTFRSDVARGSKGYVRPIRAFS